MKPTNESKQQRGSAGIDGQSLEDFESNLKDNLYVVWNRMSSGCYQPPPVMRVDIAKSDGGTRQLGIPTVADRIAQMVVKLSIEPELERHFHEDSYGYRPKKSAHQALLKAKQRCTQRAWVLDMDIKGFFDTIDHDLLMKAVRRHVKEPWQLLYIQRWLMAPVQLRNGLQEARTIGTPQGGVISPLLANLFLHYTFDLWVEKQWRGIQFERYADDIVCHCYTEGEAQQLKLMLEARFQSCGLQLHPEKTKIVYCKGGYNRKKYHKVTFDFLGYTFGPRYMRTRKGVCGLYFVAVISQKKAKAIRQSINSWPWQFWVHQDISAIQAHSKSRLQGWLNYYGLFGRSVIRNILFHFDRKLSRWMKKKFKKARTLIQAAHRVNAMRKAKPYSFSHW